MIENIWIERSEENMISVRSMNISKLKLQKKKIKEIRKKENIAKNTLDFNIIFARLCSH